MNKYTDDLGDIVESQRQNRERKEEIERKRQEKERERQLKRERKEKERRLFDFDN